MNTKNVVEFMDSGRRNDWVKCGSFSVYVRRGRHWVEGETRLCFDIANIENAPSQRGKGQFKVLVPQLVALAKAHQFEAVFVESVLNERLPACLLRLGFLPVPNSNPPSFYKRIA